MMRILLITALALWPMFAAAQSQFQTVASVDNRAVTAYEVDQRERFLRLVRTPGASADFALNQLIEDRLKIAAAERAGVRLTAEGLQNELEAFAGRANLDLDEFLQVLRSNGIERSTLEDFVSVGVTWREVVRARFSSRAQISEAEVDRALGPGGGPGASVRVLLNEIILPARPGRGEAERSMQQAQRLSQISSISRFQAEARELSVSQSRNQSGRLNWLNLAELPAALRPVLLGLQPGEVTQPLQTENAVVLFQLRAIEEIAAPRAVPAAIDYATLLLPGGAREAQSVKDRVDTCDDLYGIAKRMPREALQREARAPSDIPEDVALELAKLDAGEVSTQLTRNGGDATLFVMLCARVPSLDEEPDRDAIRNQLRSQRLAGFADSYLAELRAQAVIQTQ